MPRRSRRTGGFSLIEVLVALTLLGVALLLGMQLVLQNPRIVHRADRERQAFRAMESTMEAVRAGVIPLKTADTTEFGRFVTAVGTPAPKDLTVLMEVTPAGLTGLYEVTLTARYSVYQVKYRKQLHTLVWSPD
jgi:prepilin-type N-terminal cleavage/methylation domain-containing protein